MGQGNDRDNKLYSITETGVQKSTKGFSNVEGQFLSSKRQHRSKRNDGQEVDNEHHNSAHALDLVQRDTNRDKDQHEVDPGSEYGLELRSNREFGVLLLA